MLEKKEEIQSGRPTGRPYKQGCIRYQLRRLTDGPQDDGFDKHDNGMNSFPRKTPRAPWATYNAGDFFVTVCTKERYHYFGEIVNGVMLFSPVGEWLERELKQEAVQHHTNVSIVSYVVMPNHIHLIVHIPVDLDKAEVSADERGVGSHYGALGKPQSTALSLFVNHLKGATTRFARTKGYDMQWQSRYHDHIIRDWRDGDNIVDYIATNVRRWQHDCYNASRISTVSEMNEQLGHPDCL